MSTPPVKIAHVPVMVAEVVEYLLTDPDGLYVDGTVGLGGHAEAILARLSPVGRLLGIDLDAEALRITQERLLDKERQTVFRQGSYAQAPIFLRDLRVDYCQGIVLDLGLSSYDLETSQRGFSFQAEDPLDMRYDTRQGRPLSEVLPRLSIDTLTGILARYGEERRAPIIAEAIHRASTEGYLTTSGALARTVRGAIRGPYVNKTLARVFQALRMFVNDEVHALQTMLQRLSEILTPGGRVVILAYHSVEDRLVKEFFKRESRDCICPSHLPRCVCNHYATFRIVTARPLTPSPEELACNPRSRSAKMRVAERL